MPTLEFTRSWTDIDYRDQLSTEDLARIPANPAGTLLEDFQVVDPAAPIVYNSWVPCWFSLESTDDCCAW